MCTFIFVYSDGQMDEYDKIRQAQYEENNRELIVVEESELLKHNFPLRKTIWLKADETSFAVNVENVRYMEIKSES